MTKRQIKQDRKKQASEYIIKNRIFNADLRDIFNTCFIDRSIFLFMQSERAFRRGEEYILTYNGRRRFIKYLLFIQKRHDTLSKQAKQYNTAVYTYFAQIIVNTVWEGYFNWVEC